MNEESKEIYKNLEQIIFNNNNFKKITDINLKDADCYYMDSSGKKYVFICMVCDNKTHLYEQMNDCQDKDITYLQSKVFANQDIRWDMYFIILYRGSEDLNFDEYNQIEKNRFFCKKLVIRSASYEMMLEDLNRKLPVTGAYYSFDAEMNTLNPDTSYFEIFRKEAGLDKDRFTDDYLQTISDSMRNDFIEKLCIEEVERNG